MLSVLRPSFEVVKEGRILYAGLVLISTKHLQFDSGLFWSILGHFVVMVKQKVGKGGPFRIRL
jgi:predicted cobalt transporter CbtA